MSDPRPPLTVPLGGGRQLPWDGATGRPLRGAPFAGDVLDLVAVPSWWTLLLPARPALWVPAPLRPGPGGPPYRALPLAADELRLWRALNGARTLGQAAVAARISDRSARRLAARLTDPAVQALQLYPAPLSPRSPAPRRRWGPPRPANHRDAHATDAQGGTSLGAWHDAVTESAGHFDDRETTVAHAFARPHPALGMQPYGARLHDALVAAGGRISGARVVEVGPGTGQLAHDLWAAAVAAGGPPADYLRIDRSPGLLAAQAARCPGSRALRADATALPLPPASADLLVCNEVVADLPAIPLGDTVENDQQQAVLDRVRRHGLAPLPLGARHNLGAWQLIERTAQVLAPGGLAFVTEFGSVDEHPTETTHLDHPEVSIHFGHLRAVAESCGLSATLLPLHALLRADLGARWLGRPGHAALRALHHAAGGRLEARAWTAADAPCPEPVEGLRDLPITEDGPAPVITRFPALLLRKPG